MSAREPKIEIRGALSTDAAALSALLEELGFPCAAPRLATRLEKLSSAGEIALVAAQDGEVVGLATVHVTPVLHRPTPVGRLTALIVAARVRRAGIGKALVEAAERRLASEGCALVEVTSNQKRTEAHAFYQRLGYEITSFRFKKNLAPET